ncbi:MAG TPA: Rv3235 family protein [Mycobacteriales bacterium]|nr:Rv3235 family protein [Mycobacteriales bacterium]
MTGSPPALAAVAPKLHLRPVPSVDGPYDDEIDEPAIAPAGNLVFAFPPPTTAELPLRLAPPAAELCDGPGHHHRLPDPRPWTARLAQAIVEVLAGARPASQLSRVATLDVLALLERGSGRLGARPGGPPRRPIVGSVHVSQPRPGVAEACAVVDTGVRKRAIALRLEGRNGQWRCTALHIG